jgi:hypothetical protein
MDFEECFVALRMISVCFPLENCFELHIHDSIYWFNYVIFIGSVSTSESMIPRPCFQAFFLTGKGALLIKSHQYKEFHGSGPEQN